MHDPTKVADYRGEWIELYNTSASSININGLEVSSSNNTGFTVTDSIVVPAGGYTLLNVRESYNVNGGTNADYTYDYTTMNFGLSDNITLSNGLVTLDSVTYSRFSWAITGGKSLSLTPSAHTSSQNDSSAFWCVAASTYGDGDFGTPGTANDICPNIDADGDGFFADSDCDDTDANITVNTYFRDVDSDTYGNDSNTTTGCEAPTGYVEIGGDCNDNNSAINPDALEVCDGIDNDCDTDIDDADSNVDASTFTTFYADSDNDTYGDPLTTVDQCDVPTGFVEITGDCDDTNAGINPSASDIENNGIDENCDGVDNTGADSDGDGYTVAQGDCNDNNASISPDALEVCDGVDNDCDGGIDDSDPEGPTDGATWFLDGDSDGFAGSSTTTACSQPVGTFASVSDCDDGDANIFPNANEITADGIDQDCDGGDLCFVDADNDGFRTSDTVDSTDLDCLDSGEAQSSDPTGDCNDNSATANPNASEVCDGIDNDCDGDIDGADASVDTSTGTTYYPDNDGDLWGDSNPANAVQACTRPSGYVSNNSDCDDTDFNIKPIDSDGDGVDRCNNDCDDTDVFSYPGAAENESLTECRTDADGDGYGSESAPIGGSAGTDCDDSEVTVYTGATELCDGLDNDCDSTIDNGAVGTDYYLDNDNDGFGDAGTSQNACSQPTGYVEDATDCDDTNININPGALEVCLDGTDQDCDGADSTGICDGSLSDDNFTITGITSNDRLGQAVSYAGNIVGSTTNDIVTSSRWRSGENGAVYVFAGGALSGTSSASAADVVINGTSSERFGYDVAGGTAMLGGINSDFNGDGNDDLLIGAPNALVDSTDKGAAYLFYGPLTAGTYSDTDADVIFTAQSQNDTGHDGIDTGYAVAFVGDINNDGIGDIVISDPTKKHRGSSNGEAYLIFGKATDANANTNQFSGTVSLTEMGGNFSTLGREIHNEDNDREQMGNAVDAVGDVNGDGIDDLMIAGYRWDLNTSNINDNRGGVFVWYGGSTLLANDQLNVSHTAANHTADVTFVGAASGDQMGRSAAGAGDFDGDGKNDIVIGSEHAASTAGTVFVVAGDEPGTVTLNTSDSAVFARFIGENTGDAAGRWVSSAGNLDGDAEGTSDILIGAKLADANGVDSGALYVVLGGSSVTGTIGLGTVDAIITGEGAGNESGICVSGADDMDGDGVNEILVGSYKQNSQAGAVQLIFGSTFQ